MQEFIQKDGTPQTKPEIGEEVTCPVFLYHW